MTKDIPFQTDGKIIQRSGEAFMKAFRQSLVLFSLWVLALCLIFTVLWMLTLQ